MDKSTLDLNKFSTKLSFESETMTLTPFDFMRVIFSFSADQISHKLVASASIIAPNLTY